MCSWDASCCYPKLDWRVTGTFSFPFIDWNWYFLLWIYLFSHLLNLRSYSQSDQVDVRIKAVNLVGKLFTLPEHHAAQKYHDLFMEFLNRFSDKSVDVRISALQCAKAIYVANTSGREFHQIICKLLDTYSCHWDDSFIFSMLLASWFTIPRGFLQVTCGIL